MEIINYKKNTKPNSVRKASFTVKITKEDLERKGPLLLECTFFEKDNGEYWFNYCGKEYTSKEGKKKNWNMAQWENANMQETNSEMKGLLKTIDVDCDQSLPF